MQVGMVRIKNCSINIPGPTGDFEIVITGWLTAAVMRGGNPSYEVEIESLGEPDIDLDPLLSWRPPQETRTLRAAIESFIIEAYKDDIEWRDYDPSEDLKEGE